MKIKLLAIAMLFSVAAVNADVTTGGVSVFMPVAMNGTAASNLGWSGSIYQHDSDELRACFKVQLEYGANNKRSEIGKYLSPSGTDTFIVGPVKTTAANATTDIAGINLLFDDLFLSGNVTFKPKAQDLVVDFGMYVDLAEWLDGLYFRSHMPLQHSRWEVEIDEAAVATAAAAFTTGQVDVGAGAAAIYTTVADAFKGDKTVGDSTLWSYGKIDGKRTATKLGDVNLTLGYNFINKEHCHLGVGVTGILGAGGKTKAEYVFEPIIGYAGRFGVGGTIDGGARLWDRDDTHQLVANMTFYAAHLFDNEQRRSYDLTDSGDMSRYLLVKTFNATPAYVGTAGSLTNVNNIASLKAKIGIDVVYNGNITFCWQMDNVSVDFGYQVAGHGKEKHKSWVDTITASTYALYDSTSTDAATMDALDNNQAVDLVAISGLITGQATAATPSAANGFFISNDSLNKDSGLMKSAVEHTLFAGVNYTWSDNEWMPSVGALGSYHIAGSDNNTFDRWSVGVQFNFCV